MRFADLADWLAWQEQLHSTAIDLGLERTERVWSQLGGARPAPIVITVAGTNGKGSVVALLESILLAAGFKVGSYTSPHIWCYNERIRVNGTEVTDRSLCDSFSRIDTARGEESLTYFEFGTLAAFDIFSRQYLDVALLEVGLGGRLDATNIIDADVAIVTSVDLDHTDWLGSDRETIGREKAGIFRPGRPVICGDPDPPLSIAAYSEQLGAELIQLNRDFSFDAQERGWSWRGGGGRRHALPRPALAGEEQLQNAAVALMALERLRDRLPVSQAAVRQGLLRVRLPGRFQIVPGGVETILDVAHNPAAAEVLAANLGAREIAGKTVAVVAMLADKAAAATLRPLITHIDQWYLAATESVRSLSAEDLNAALVAAGGADGSCYPSVELALAQALDDADSADRIVVFGSFYTVAAVVLKSL